MKSSLARVAVALLGLGVTACGGGDKGTGSTSRASSNTTAVESLAATTVPEAAPSTLRYLRGDGDDDDDAGESTTMNGSAPIDSDIDRDNDYRDNLHKGYYDKDDGRVKDFGRAASASEKRAVMAVFRRYHAAAVASDGVTACALLSSALAKSSVQDFGRGSAGPAFLSSATTCQAVMSLLFEHYHSELATPIEMTGVRVKGDQAYVLLGSRTLPASYVTLWREAGAWTIYERLGTVLP